MITKELVDYIRTNQLRGVTKEKLVQALILAGWAEKDIQDAYLSLEPKPDIPPVSPSVPESQFVPQDTKPAFSPPGGSFKPTPPLESKTQPVFNPKNYSPDIANSGGFVLEPKIIVEDIPAQGQSISPTTRSGKSKKWIAPLVILIVLVVGGYFGMKMFSPLLLSKFGNATKQTTSTVPTQPKASDIPPANTNLATPTPLPPPVKNYNLAYLGGDTSQKINLYGTDGNILNSFDSSKMNGVLPGQNHVASNGRVLYMTSDLSSGYKTTIWVKDIGADPKKVITLSSLLVFASISNDGTSVAYIVSTMNGGKYDYKLWRVNGDGSSNKQISDLGKILSVPQDGNTLVEPNGWSSDLSTVYVTLIGTKAPYSTFAIDSASGAKKTSSFPNKIAWLPSFSDDGGKIVYVSYTEDKNTKSEFGIPPYSINVFDTSLGLSEKILESKTDIYSYPVMSIDGSSVAYSVQKDKTHSTGLFLVSRSNSTPIKIYSETGSAVIEPVAFLSEKTLVFNEISTSGKGNVENLYLINTDGTNKKLIVSSKKPGTYGKYLRIDQNPDPNSTNKSTSTVQKDLNNYPGYHKNDKFGFEFTYDKNYEYSDSGSNCTTDKTCAEFRKITANGFTESYGVYLSYSVITDDVKNPLPKLGALYYTSVNKVPFYIFNYSPVAGVETQYCAVQKNNRICFYASDPNQPVDEATMKVIQPPAVTALLKSALSSFKFSSSAPVVDSATSPATSVLQAGSIKLIYPLNNQTVVSGSKITVKYEITGPVKFGAVNIIPDSCIYTVTAKDTVGQHSFDCKLPNKVGALKIGIVDMINFPKPDSKSANGQISLVAPSNLTVKDISFSSPSVFMMATQTPSEEDYVVLSAIYSDGSKREVDASNYTYSIVDNTIAAVFDKPMGQIIPLYGKKVGKTQMIFNYKGIKKVVPVEVYPTDKTLQ